MNQHDDGARISVKPRVSVGIPVHNGEDFLAQALDAMLAQSFPDFEILISDNASTDRTAAIAQAYAARDSRIHYFANERNIGLARNHNRVLELASGEYFMWHAHDDQAMPDYLARCVQVLDQNPGVVLCFAKNIDIDEYGIAIDRDNAHRRRELPSDTLAFDAGETQVRFRDVIQLNHQCEPDYGVMRRDVLRATCQHGNYADADRVLLAELILQGPFRMIREPLFLHREHAQRSVKVFPTRQARAALIDPDLAGRIVFPHWRELGELWACIGRAPIDTRERNRCRRELLRWVVDYRLRLASDLNIGARAFLRKAVPLPVQRTIRKLRGRAPEPIGD